ncbi:SWIM zinc finger family protein [Actinomyces mediterranea]|uniref:SWIM zinc finger family protein n=1 Tax=Actinomyces mediterranea TaxID=1871028 RepID=UPI0009FAEF2D
MPVFVTLRWNDDGVTGQCTCPHFADGNFCKHLVALGLAVVDAAHPIDESTDREATASESIGADDRIDDYPDSLSPENLKKDCHTRCV